MGNNYRKFYLTNRNGDTYQLTDNNFNHFFNEPSGLGFKKNVETKRIGNSEIIVRSSYDCPQVTGELLFYYDTNEKAYQDYFDFVSFLSFEPIKLHYLPPNTFDSVYIDCQVINADKSEIEYNTNTLRVPITFKGTTPWLSDNTVTITERNNLDEGKHYDLERPYYYAGSSLSNIKINNEGTDEVGFIFEVNGTVSNPQFILYQDDKVYGTCKITGSLYSYVKVDSTDLNEEIVLKRNNAIIANPASYQDLSIINGGALTFIKLKTGISKMTFTCTNIDSFDGTVSISFHKEYISY